MHAASVVHGVALGALNDVAEPLRGADVGVLK